jgi:hypothetical protein
MSNTVGPNDTGDVGPDPPMSTRNGGHTSVIRPGVRRAVQQSTADAEDQFQQLSGVARGHCESHQGSERENRDRRATDREKQNGEPMKSPRMM